MRKRADPPLPLLLPPALSNLCMHARTCIAAIAGGVRRARAGHMCAACDRHATMIGRLRRMNKAPRGRLGAQRRSRRLLAAPRRLAISLAKALLARAVAAQALIGICIAHTAKQ